MNELSSLLLRAGLNNDEAKLLLTLYQRPSSPAGRLAEYAGFKRGYTYSLLSSLTSQGLIQEVIERGIKRFTAVSPLRLAERIDQQRNELTELEKDLRNSLGKFENLIPSLKSLPRVQVFRGASGVKELYQFTLTSKEKIIRACADFSTVFPRKRSPELNAWLWKYASRRAKHGIIYKGIVTKSAESDLAYKYRKIHKRELKVLPDSSLLVEVNIFDKYLAITSTSEETMGVLIESQPLAESAKQLFDALWGLPQYSLTRAKRKK